MAKLLQFKSRRRIEEEASVWLSRMDRGLDAQTRAALQDWVDQDPRHARALIAMAALWDEMDLMRELSGLLELPVRAVPVAGTWRGWWWAAAAAAPLALAGLLLLQRPAIAPDDSPAQAVQAQAHGKARRPAGPALPQSAWQTAVGEQRTEVLPDGSIMHLNTATRVEVAFSARERTIAIVRGEAHFEVQHDPSRPFIVAAGGHRIRAVGTAFNVRLERSGRLEVIVTEGQILVTARALAGRSDHPGAALTEARVGAGEQLQADGIDQQWRVQPLLQETLSSRLAWQRGMLVFDGEPLEAALAEVARYTDVRFEIRDDALRAMRIGGFYKSGDIDGLVRSLEQNLGIVATRERDGRVVLAARPRP